MSSCRNVSAKCGCNSSILLSCVLYTNWDICIYGSQNNCSRARAPSWKNVMVFVCNISLILLGSWCSGSLCRLGVLLFFCCFVLFFKFRMTVTKVHSKVSVTATLLFWALLHHPSQWKGLLTWIRVQDLTPVVKKKMLCWTDGFMCWSVYVDLFEKAIICHDHNQHKSNWNKLLQSLLKWKLTVTCLCNNNKKNHCAY